MRRPLLGRDSGNSALDNAGVKRCTTTEAFRIKHLAEKTRQ
jgi:hypothetical protein